MTTPEQPINDGGPDIIDFSVTVDHGKYTVIVYEKGRMVALRYGKPWRDLTGDNLVYWLATEVKTLRLAAAQNKL
jgi:hypothetical protein